MAQFTAYFYFFIIKRFHMTPSADRTVRIWDLPTRVFHLALIVCVSGLVITGEMGGATMRWHFYLGYAVLTLIFFRFAWGLVGGRWSRFVHFVPTPSVLRYYLLDIRRGQAQGTPGHNPLGAMSVLALLLLLLLQVLSGLLSDDEIYNMGPWAAWATGQWVAWATHYHTEIGKAALVGWVLLHLGAVLFYKYRKGEDLITPMLSGDKQVSQTITAQTPPSTDDWRTRTLAVLLLVVCAYAVFRVVNFTWAV